jgi:hypothetical protein
LFAQADCLAGLSTSVDLDLEERQGSELAVAFKETRIESTKLPMSGVDTGLITNVSPATELHIRGTLTENGTEASRATVLVAPGWTTDVTLYPLEHP